MGWLSSFFKALVSFFTGVAFPSMPPTVVPTFPSAESGQSVWDKLADAITPPMSTTTPPFALVGAPGTSPCAGSKLNYNLPDKIYGTVRRHIELQHIDFAIRGVLAYQDVFYTNVPSPLSSENKSDGNSLVFLPYPNFVDICDVNHGALLRRVTLTEQLQQVADVMSIDAGGTSAYLITNAGLTEVQLGSAPLAIGTVSPPSGVPGTQLTILGSGFQPTTTAFANGQVAATTFVDAKTLTIVLHPSALVLFNFRSTM